MIDIKIVIGLGGFLFGIALMISMYINNREINKKEKMFVDEIIELTCENKKLKNEVEQLEINRNIYMRDRD